MNPGTLQTTTRELSGSKLSAVSTCGSQPRCSVQTQLFIPMEV